MSGAPSEAVDQGYVLDVLCTNLVTNVLDSSVATVGGYNGAQILELVAVGTVAAQTFIGTLLGSYDGVRWYVVGVQQIGDATGVTTPARALSFTLTPGSGTVAQTWQVLDPYIYLKIHPTTNTLGTGLTAKVYAVPL